MSCACDSTSNPVGRYDGQIPQGATWTKTLTWKTGSPAAAVNLTGYTARMDLVSAGQPTISLTTANACITLGGAAGTITLLLDAATTAAMAATTYAYDLELVQGSTVTRLLEGFQQVTPNITA